jgi:hypothetical protein
MKLYTEEQLIQAFKSGMNACMKHKDWALAINYPNKIELLEYMQSLTPIKLPSDEEIREERLLQFPDSEYANRANDRLAFYCGARMVINKIQGGNNENNI